jgi:hypothetical protein
VAEPPRKRKERDGAGAAGGAPTDAGGTSAANGSGPASRPTPQERMRQGYAKAELRNEAARRALTPLADGERPTVVTVGAILAALIAISIVITYAAGVRVNGSTPHLTSVLAPVLILGVMAWGMWRARYWAVLGFQVILVFLIFTSVYGLLVEATSVTEFAVTVGLLAVSGTLFWLMIKAMARIQMPERLPRQ